MPFCGSVFVNRLRRTGRDPVAARVTEGAAEKKAKYGTAGTVSHLHSC